MPWLRARSIVLQLTVVTALLMSTAVAVLTAVHFSQEHREVAREIEIEVGRIEHDLLPTIAEMAWTMNASQVNTLLRGLVASDVLAAVEIEVYGLATISSGPTIASSETWRHELTLYPPPRVGTEPIGSLTLHIYRPGTIIARRGSIAWSFVFESIVMAIILGVMYLIVRRMVADPLHRLHAALEQIDPEESSTIDAALREISPQHPTRTGARPANELDAVRESIYSTFSRLQAEIQRREGAEAILQQSLNEKTVLLREVHHRVKNNLQIMISLLSLQWGQSNDPDVRAALADSEHRVQSMAMVHELLYQSHTVADLSLLEYVTELGHHIMPRPVLGQERPQLTVAGDPCSVTIDVAIPIGLIVNELLTNSVRHAFKSGQAGAVRIMVRECPTCRSRLGHLQVRDNGVGFPPGFDWRTTHSLGLQIVRSLATQLRAELHISSSASGTVVNLWFPESGEERIGTQDDG